MLRPTLLLAVLLATAGCAAATAGGSSSSAPKLKEGAIVTDAQGKRYRVVCTTERPTGSNISERVCRTVAATEDVQRLQDQFRMPSPARNQALPGG